MDLLDTQEQMKFEDFALEECILQDIKASGYHAPTPIQAQTIPLVLEGKDVIGLAQTGTGKTAAFALPIIQKLHGRMELGALVIVPTRELAQQTAKVFQMLGKSSGVRVVVLVGGLPMDADRKAITSWPNVIIATPGRLIDHLESNTLNLREVEILAVDEADRMHDMGFMPQLRRIFACLPEQRQTVMFTATLPKDVQPIVHKHMIKPVTVQVGLQLPAERAEQQIIYLPVERKTDVLLDLLKHNRGRTLIFCRTKRGVDKLATQIGRSVRGITRLHADREQCARDEAMAGFRAGKYRILMATDIAARGIDVADIEHVINFDFPHAADDYIHRIGRTARVAATGKATSFVTPPERKYLRNVQRLLEIPITNLTDEDLSAPPPVGSEEHGSRRGHRRGPPRGGRRGRTVQAKA